VIEKQKERAEKYDEETDFGTFVYLRFQSIFKPSALVQWMPLLHVVATPTRAAMCSEARW